MHAFLLYRAASFKSIDKFLDKYDKQMEVKTLEIIVYIPKHHFYFLFSLLNHTHNYILIAEMNIVRAIFSVSTAFDEGS